MFFVLKLGARKQTRELTKETEKEIEIIIFKM